MNVKHLVQRLWSTPARTRLETASVPRNTADRGEAPRAVWCLSTGRVGSQTLAALAALADDVTSVHEPEPKLYGLGKIAYEEGEGMLRDRALVEAVRTCRSHLLKPQTSHYIETSPQVTFLAPILGSIFPQSHFIHVIRHPAEVIRSGMRRRWYAGHPSDNIRIHPSAGGEIAQQWPSLDAFEKTAWLWVETNRWIRAFLESVPPERKLVIKSEDLFAGEPETLKQFFGTLKSAVPGEKSLAGVLTKRLNAQRTGDFPSQQDWSPDQIAVVRRHAGELMEEFGYRLPP